MVSVKTDGYLVLRDVLSPQLLQQFKLWAMDNTNAHRGNAVDGTYYATHDGKRAYNVWWTTQPPKEMWMPIVWSLEQPINMFFDGAEWDIHVVDCITTRPHSQKIYAHIDTPYRFEEFSKVDRTLGVQIIIPLDDFTLENGATAYLPGSCNMKIDYRDLEEFRDVYNDMLVDSGTQFLSKPGDVLMYDSRTLHSTMPNNSNEFRSALLINILEKDIIPRVRELDKNTDFVKT